MSVELRAVTEDNFRDVIELEVLPASCRCIPATGKASTSWSG